eukprot:5482383-Alexandrium_andersonii.AAC.1
MPNPPTEQVCERGREIRSAIRRSANPRSPLLLLREKPAAAPQGAGSALHALKAVSSPLRDSD